MIGRYSLVVEDNKTHKKTCILVKEFESQAGKFVKKEKVRLSTIDRGTTKFNSEEELLLYFKNAGYIDSTDAYIYIEYKSGGLKKLEIAYSDTPELAYFSSKASTYVSESDSRFKDFFEKFMNNMRNGTFYRFMFDNKYIIDDYIKTKIDICIYDSALLNLTAEDINFVKEKISKSLSRYKALRGAVIGTREYHKSRVSKEEIKEVPEKIPEVETSNEDINWAFNRGGYDALFNYFSIDEIYRLPEAELEELGLSIKKCKK